MNTTPLACDYMNRDLVYLREGDRPEVALKPMLEFGITAVPILDDEHRPVGVITLRDLSERHKKRARLVVKTIWGGATVADAAHTLATENLHHLIVVGEDGEAIGMLSSLDVVRGLLGFPARHPSTTKRFAAATQSDEEEYTRE